MHLFWLVKSNLSATATEDKFPVSVSIWSVVASECVAGLIDVVGRALVEICRRAIIRSTAIDHLLESYDGNRLRKLQASIRTALVDLLLALLSPG